MSRYRSSGPSPLLVIVVGAFVVFGGYFVWTGFLSFLEDRGDITAQVTRQAFSTATAKAGPVLPPTMFFPATFTPLPPCQWFKVTAERAVYRECPSQDNRQCPVRDVVTFGTELCVYSRAPGNPEWYVIELNPGGAYRDTVFMHESVIKPVDPTPTPTQTYTPLPTITPVPSRTSIPTGLPGPTHTPNPAMPPTLAPPLTPSPPLPEVSI
jgi:hypothetical protein